EGRRSAPGVRGPLRQVAARSAPDEECRVQNAECRIQSAEFRMQSVEKRTGIMTFANVRVVGICALLAATLLAGRTAQAELTEKTVKVGNVTVHYKVVVPNGYDASRTYPAILAFGGGPQTMNTVDSVLTRNLRTEAEKRGYIVIAPAAPDGALFFEDGARIFPEFLKRMLADYKIENGRFHIAGPSNGGIAAF